MTDVNTYMLWFKLIHVSIKEVAGPSGAAGQKIFLWTMENFYGKYSMDDRAKLYSYLF